ncbi:hypothetical protein ACJJTC_010382 [Scirpophaga incertulas]
MKGLKKNKKLHVNSAAIVWLDFVLLNHESKVKQPVKQLGWQCRIFTSILISETGYARDAYVFKLRSIHPCESKTKYKFLVKYTKAKQDGDSHRSDCVTEHAWEL